MISHTFDQATGTLHLHPEGTIMPGDFQSITEEVDAYLEQHDHLNGVVISAEKFPGWKNLTAMLEHLKFVRNHHRKIDHVAIVTDDRILSHMPGLTKHFVHADVRQFSTANAIEAENWVVSIPAHI